LADGRGEVAGQVPDDEEYSQGRADVEAELKGGIQEVGLEGGGYLLGIYAGGGNNMGQLCGDATDVEEADHNGDGQAGSGGKENASQDSMEKVSETDESVEAAEVVNDDGQGEQVDHDLGPDVQVDAGPGGGLGGDLSGVNEKTEIGQSEQQGEYPWPLAGDLDTVVISQGRADDNSGKLDSEKDGDGDPAQGNEPKGIAEGYLRSDLSRQARWGLEIILGY